MSTKIKLRLEGRALGRSSDIIINVIRTSILTPPQDSHPVATEIRREQQVVAGSPRTHHSRHKRRRNVNCKPPPRDKSYAPITQSNVIMSVQMSHKVRGRSSLKFISNHGKDYHSNLQEVTCVIAVYILASYDFSRVMHVFMQEHLTYIVEFVNERNTSQRGMCNVKAIQTHLLSKCDTFFETGVMYYASEI